MCNSRISGVNHFTLSNCFFIALEYFITHFRRNNPVFASVCFDANFSHPQKIDLIYRPNILRHWFEDHIIIAITINQLYETWQVGSYGNNIPDKDKPIKLFIIWEKLTSNMCIWITKNDTIYGNVQRHSFIRVNKQWPLLLTWFNFNPSMDK